MSHTLNDKHHKRIKTITNTMVELNNPTFSFDFISRGEIVKETKKFAIKQLLKGTIMQISKSPYLLVFI